MKRNRLSIIAYIVIGLGAIGLITQLFKNPATLFKSVFFMIMISLIIFAFIYFFIFRNRKMSKEMRKYNQAVKQSKLKYNKTSTYTERKHLNSNPKFKMRKRGNRHAPHLRVIEGNKSKRKNRATF